ncbi:MAG TPA: hypothetical protein VKU41_19195 [Polyangiaceae bacterium]|nr:hypothetical protein [Polyangiaceae bacterium]
MRLTLVSALVVAPILGSRDGSAQEPPSAPAPSSAASAPEQQPALVRAARDDQDLARLTELMQRWSSNTNGYRVWGALSGVAIAGATIPAGIVMLNRPDGEEPGALALGVGIGSALGGGLLLLVSPLGSFQPVVDVLEAGRAAGKPPGEIVKEAEAKWRTAADSMKDFRTTVGALDACFGALSLAGGTYLAVANLSSQDFSKKEQYGSAAALSAFGAFAVVFGLRGVFYEESIEAAWDAYESRRPHDEPAVKVNGVGVVPVRGGATLGLNASF